MRRRIRIGLAIAALVAPALATGHQVGVSYSELVVEGRAVEGRLKLSARELAAVAPSDSGLPVTERALASRRPELFRLTLGAVGVTEGVEPCAFSPGSAALEAPDGIALTGRWRCPGTIERLHVRAGFLASLPAGHVHLAKVEAGGRIYERVARVGSEDFDVDLEGSPGWRAQAARFLALGVEHIFTGYDHIAFLLGLLLLGGTLRALVKVVTSFTVAHSITLALAALGIVTPPARLVEPLIAASIVFVAAENLWAVRSQASVAAVVAASRRRWRITFAFGLVHGFGFASVLRELHLPRSGLAASLVTFNLGVELGQICIVAVAFPLLAWLRRRGSFMPQGVRAGSLAIGALGLFWLVQRAAWAA